MPTPQFTSNELQTAIFNISNLLSAGLLAADVFKEMQQLQNKHADYWKTASKQASNGQTLSTILRPILDDASHAAIHAAEYSGTLSEVLNALDLAMEEKKDIRKTLQTMFYPFGMLVTALGVFTLYLAFVVPSISKAAPNHGEEKSTLNIVADGLHNFLMNYSLHLLVGIIAFVFIIIYWLRDPDNRNTIFGTLDNTPVLGPATRDLFYGEWATHMAINTRAGVSILDSIHLTLKMLPAYYQPEIQDIANNVTRLGLATAANPNPKINAPRNKVPTLIVNAFRIADKTGEADVYFKKTGAALLTQGKKRIQSFVKILTPIIIIISAMLGAGSILPYFVQISDAFLRLN